MSIIASSGGVNRIPKNWYGVSGGVNRKLQSIYGAAQGANRKLFSAYVCRAHNFYSDEGIYENGSVHCNQSEDCAIFSLLFDSPITIHKGDPFFKMSNLFSGGQLWVDDAYNPDKVYELFSNDVGYLDSYASGNDWTLFADKDSTSQIFYIATNGQGVISWDGCTLQGIPINPVELI